MKKQLFGLMTILTIFNACQKNEVSVSLPEEVTIHAKIEDKDATKTVMDESNNILWSENDQIIAFMKSSYGYKYQVKPSFVGKSFADFSMISSGNSSDLSAGNEWEHNVVYYPYSEDIECLKSGANYTLEVNLPAEQAYVPDSFANGSMPMVAVSESNNITFKNVLGGIKLQLKGTQIVKFIKVTGKNNEKLSGAAIVTAYTDETKPAITMTSGASKSVILNCGSGVQLNESTATEFIISLPPVLFSKGFTVTVTDAEGKTYTVETGKANTVLRSSILTMPAFELGGSPSDEDADDELIVPVVSISISATFHKLGEGNSFQLIATVKPNDATDKTVVWSSNIPTVATVDQTGLVTGISAGTATISASAGGNVAECKIAVSILADYIDEYGSNRGKGTAIGKAIWAPVNCGYHETDFMYGKLYQWGRKYGQGYSGNLYDINENIIGEFSDSTVPTIEEGGISAITGQHTSKSNVFFKGTSEYNYDWLYPQDGKLWNSGSESKPVKTEYDPCPDGWRIPTNDELNDLNMNHSRRTNENGQVGYWFSGPNPYSESAPQVFLPIAGYRYYDGSAKSRGRYYGRYWSSKASGSKASSLCFYFNQMTPFERAVGHSVRCVQE